MEGVVEGSVVRSGGRVRITAQLIHAPTDRHLWARSYERRAGGRARAAGRGVARDRRGGPHHARHGGEPAAHAAASGEARRRTTPTSSAGTTGTSGRSRPSRRRSSTSRRPSPRIRTSPSLTPAWPWPTRPRLVFGYVPPGRGLAEQKAAALRALELDPGLGEARAALGVRPCAGVGLGRSGGRIPERRRDGPELHRRRTSGTAGTCARDETLRREPGPPAAGARAGSPQHRRSTAPSPETSPPPAGTRRPWRSGTGPSSWSRIMRRPTSCSRVFHFERGRSRRGRRGISSAPALSSPTTPRRSPTSPSSTP